MQRAMPRRFCINLLVTAGAALGLAVLVSCKAQQGPRNIESTIVTEVKQKITIGGREWKNPIPDTEASQQEGSGHFQHHCMICHGLDGHATGVPFAAKMDPPVPDLSSRDVQGYTDGQLKWVIQNGIAPSGMPAWNGILDDGEMWSIVNYLRHLPPKASLGIPAVYKEAAAEHDQSSAKPKTKSVKRKRARKHPH